MTSNTAVRSAAALATALLVGGLAPTSSASADPADGVAQARGGRDWHLTLGLGKGPRKVRFYTCNSVDQYGSVTFRYKATTRKTSDQKQPRVELEIADGGSDSGSEFSLFPGDKTVIESIPGLHTTAQVHLSLHNQGKSRTLDFTLAQVLPC